jgi:23S rRNA pseudoU1915 N3-methylase RlmH
MRLAIVAVGRLKDGPERALYLTYAKRLDEAGRALALGPLALAELAEGRAQTVAQRREDEARRLLERARDASVTVALDGGGKSLASEAFARWLAEQRDGGARSGGAQGGPVQAVPRADDAAARPRAGRAGGAALPGGNHPRRASVSQGLRPAACHPRQPDG